MVLRRKRGAGVEEIGGGKWRREKEVGGEALVGAVSRAALPSHCCCCECRPVCCCPVTEGWCDALYTVLTVFYNTLEEPEHSLPW